MRTLLIDNYDSFTYNLYQYLAACNGEEPVVVRNDEMSWDQVERIAFDNIVISPGPGRPQRQTDLGLSSDALCRSEVPVLGVCLGHQAIAHHCGATVDLAMRPMHGRLDRISHAQRDLFRGIPDRFEAVRYHSLAVTSLPPTLEALAWAPDGTLMALRHLRRPWWGVQFHPESICTEFGARLLRNFRDLSIEWTTRITPRNTIGSFVNDPAPPQRTMRVHARCLEFLAEPATVFADLYGGSDTAFWLDSSLAQPGCGRFSFMGDASGPRASIVQYRCATGELTVSRADITEVSQQSVFDYLSEQLLAQQAIAEPELPFEFTGGYVGYFGYELKTELGGEATHVASTPDAAWVMADRFIAFDHAEENTWIVCVDQGELGAENSLWMDALAQRLAAPPAQALERYHAASALLQLEWRTPLQRYRELIQACQQEILQGETYELCLTNQLQGTGDIDALGVYLALRALNPAPFSAYLRHQSLRVLCASPELFLHVATDRTVQTKPIKGTAARGATPQEDAQLAQSLREDEKAQAENLMIVDLLRNDLNRVCEVGSVHVPARFSVESYATVHQLVSTIAGRVRGNLTAVDVVKAAFPGGSMTGAPKIRTMAIIDRLEGAARGIYSGSVGYLSLNGAAQLNIVIRTIVVDGVRVSIGAGGAIIALSDAQAEVEEIVLKARAQLEALRRCGAMHSEVSAAAPPASPNDGD